MRDADSRPSQRLLFEVAARLLDEFFLDLEPVEMSVGDNRIVVDLSNPNGRNCVPTAALGVKLFSAIGAVRPRPESVQMKVTSSSGDAGETSPSPRHGGLRGEHRRAWFGHLAIVSDDGWLFDPTAARQMKLGNGAQLVRPVVQRLPPGGLQTDRYLECSPQSGSPVGNGKQLDEFVTASYRKLDDTTHLTDPLFDPRNDEVLRKWTDRLLIEMQSQLRDMGYVWQPPARESVATDRSIRRTVTRPARRAGKKLELNSTGQSNGAPYLASKSASPAELSATCSAAPSVLAGIANGDERTGESAAPRLERSNSIGPDVISETATEATPKGVELDL